VLGTSGFAQLDEGGRLGEDQVLSLDIEGEDHGHRPAAARDEERLARLRTVEDVGNLGLELADADRRRGFIVVTSGTTSLHQLLHQLGRHGPAQSILAAPAARTN
jgi:hypothetical protein